MLQRLGPFCNCVCQWLVIWFHYVVCCVFLWLMNCSKQQNGEMTLSLCPLDQPSFSTLLPSSDGRRLQGAARQMNRRMLVQQLMSSNSMFQMWYLELASILICNCILSWCSFTPAGFCRLTLFFLTSNQQLPYLCQPQPTPPSLPRPPLSMHTSSTCSSLISWWAGCTLDLNWSPVNLVFMSPTPVCFF